MFASRTGSREGQVGGNVKGEIKEDNRNKHQLAARARVVRSLAQPREKAHGDRGNEERGDPLKQGAGGGRSEKKGANEELGFRTQETTKPIYQILFRPKIWLE